MLRFLTCTIVAFAWPVIVSAEEASWTTAVLNMEPSKAEWLDEWEDELSGDVKAKVASFSAELPVAPFNRLGEEIKLWVPEKANAQGCKALKLRDDASAAGRAVAVRQGGCTLEAKISNAQKVNAKGLIIMSDNDDFYRHRERERKDIFVLSVPKAVGEAIRNYRDLHEAPILVRMRYYNAIFDDPGSLEQLVSWVIGTILIFGLFLSMLMSKNGGVFCGLVRKLKSIQPQDAGATQEMAHMEHEGGHHGGGDFTASQQEFFHNRQAAGMPPSRRVQLMDSGWGSVALVVGTALSLIIANSRFGDVYIAFWETHVGFGPHEWHLNLPVREWINEAFMSFFFFVVGLEIKHEMMFGSLTTVQQAALPCVAALGGMLVPAFLYCAVQLITGNELAGWAIPMATDIAFAMGVYNIFRSRLPGSVAAYLLTLATVDDLGAIAVIAIAFTGHVNMTFLAGAVIVCALLEWMRRNSVASSSAWGAAAISLWYCMLRGGVNADIAGVVVGFAIPAISAPKHTKCTAPMPNLLDHYIHWWTAYNNFVIMPLFAIANTAVKLSASPGDVATSPISQGIMVGLLLGKPLGIAGSSFIVLKLGWCTWPTGMTPIHLVISGLLGGIAFTMSLFLIEQSLVGLPVMFAKLAVIIASTLAGVFAALIMMHMKAPEDKPQNDHGKNLVAGA